MKIKLGKIAFVVICIITMIMPYGTTVLATALNHSEVSTNLETLKLREGGEESSGTLTGSYASYYDENIYSYAIGTTNVLKLIVSGDTKYENAFYCLNAKKSFPGTTSLVYKNVGNLKDDTNVNVAALGLSAASYKSLIWLVNNMYLEKQAPEQKEEFLYKAFATEIENEELTLDLIKAFLTDDDIEVVQQWAMWYFTNGDLSNISTYDVKYSSFAAVTLTNIQGDSGSYLDITGSDIRQEFAEKLYTYLITEAKSANEAQLTYPKIISGTPTVVVEDEYYKAGPFKVSSGTASSASYNLKLTDGNNEISREQYNILIEGQDVFTNKNINEIFDTNYYIYLPINNNINKLKLSLTYSSYETEASLWTTTDTVYQPVTLITRKVTPHEESVEVNIEEVTADLALRKYIIKVNNETFNRIPTVDVSNLTNETSTTAEYKHAKNPIEVECGDTVIYEIRVYNEGDISAKATQIIDYLPEGLEFVNGSDINNIYEWVLSADGRTVTTTYLKNTTLEPFNKTTGKLESSYVQIECKITDNLKSGEVLTNIAEIRADNINDRDSVTNSLNISTIDTEKYSGNNNNKTDLSDSNYYYKGLEDDDDFEKVIVKGKVFDLALQKFISKINNVAPTISREPKVDITKLKNGSSKNADYTQVKTPLVVEQGDVVLYTIRVYNEGDIDGYAEEVTDYLPDGLGFLVNHTTNIDNYWAIPQSSKSVKLSSITNGTKNLKLDDFTNITNLDNVEVITGKVKLTSTKLKSSSTDTKNLIKGFDKENSTTLNYKDIQVACIVLTDTASKDNLNLKNIAEIEKHSDENRDTDIEDRDSTPGTVNTDNYPGEDKNQDDHDYEILTTEEPKEFDLSLQKFITKLNDADITNRVPTITKNSDGSLRYSHTTEALAVANNDLVTYTIRVYNEGDIDGYAKQISDDLPKGLVFVKDDETNKKYEWKLYDSNGNETEDLSKAVIVKTSYLSKKSSEARGENNLIKAYDSSKAISTDASNANPDYRDVKIVFKVSESVVSSNVSNLSNRTIINTAEISDDEDVDGNEVKDKDSIPGNNKLEEDDIDQERVAVKYFDLALKKEVIKAIVTEDGTTREISATDPKLLKVEINKKKISSTIVKFVFNITVTNEGEIPGYATEVKDHVPNGLEFVEADNKNWIKVSDRVITTNALAKTLLKPGESASVQVTLRWMNSESNIGLKTNIAEISDDWNENSVKDIDSTPNNYSSDRDSEDDEDKASVLLGISTGNTPVYIVLSTTVLTILSTGVILIKKYVLF